MDITLLYFDSCPNWKQTDRDLAALADEFDLTLSHQTVDTIEEAAAWRFRGSPTVLVDGVDPFARPEDPVGLSCRIYSTPDGLAGAPTTDMLRAALGA